MWRLLASGAAALLVSSVVGLVVRAAEMTDEPLPRLLDVLPKVLLRTHVGHAWLVRMAALIVLSLATVWGRYTSRAHRQQFIVLGCAVIAAAMDSASGHASDAGDFTAAELIDWLHLLAALVWGGGLLVLSIVVLPRFAKVPDLVARRLPGVAVRFSALAAPAAALIAVTAAYQAWTYGGHFAEVTRSPFGRTIIAKTVLFGLLLVLGAFNRFVTVPRLRQWADSPSAGKGGSASVVAPASRADTEERRGHSAAAWFARAVKLEALVVVAILLCAALLRHEAPARHPPHLEHHGAVRASWLSRKLATREWARPPPTSERTTAIAFVDTAEPAL